MDHPTPSQQTAYFDGTDFVVENLHTADPAVILEAARWSTGERGDPVSGSGDLADVDLSVFAFEALSVGARVLAIAAQSSETLAVQQAVRAAGDQVDDAVRRATEAISQTTRDANETLLTQVTRLVGGENPELMERLRPVLAKVGTDLEAQVAVGIAKANLVLRDETERRHAELTGLIREVHRDLAVKDATETALLEGAASIKGSTTAKGADFEDRLHLVFHDIAAALGDEYQETGTFAGRLSRNRKGDGVLHIQGNLARVVIEAHDGTSKEWGSYLAEAERNRGASASIGVVRRIEDNAGHAIRVIGPKRLVVAFDPGVDTPDLLRTIVLLMRTVALTSSGRFGTEEVATANEHIREAVSVLDDLDEAKKSASAISTNAAKIEQVATRVMTTVQRELHGALTALTGALETGADSESTDGNAAVTEGAA